MPKIMTKDKKQPKERTKDIELNENVQFGDLMLSKHVLDGLKAAGFIKPSPIQFKAIPLGKLGLDLIVQAKSGTGKTCVFSVIALENLLNDCKALQTLILAPTREVALQITGVIKRISSNMKKVRTYAFIGGHSVSEDLVKLKQCQIAVGTPGRISHLIKEKHLKTDNIRLFIIDEADRLLAPEFQEDINLIYSNLPENKQIIALSATYPTYMATYVTRYMRSATYVRLNAVDPSLRGIKQFYKIIPNTSNMENILFDAKIEELVRLFSTVEFTQCIVFTNYQLRAEYLCTKLNEQGWPAIFIAGNIEQAKRNKAINELKQFKCRILVSTDLTSRGIDAENVDFIVCMDVPSDAETYLHRIGRAGRYGKSEKMSKYKDGTPCLVAFQLGTKGVAVSFVNEKTEIEQFESIISTYKLYIQQYKAGLDDLVQEHNAYKPNDNRTDDDVTIERVQISSAQLHESLEQYEKAKIALTQRRTAKNEVKQDEVDVCLFNSLDEIKESLKAFTETNEFKCRQQSNKVVGERIQKFEFESFQDEREKLKKLIQSKLHPELIPILPADLVEPIIKQKSKKSKKIYHEELDAETLEHYYKFYYNFYFFHYYKHFMYKHVYKC